MRIIASYSFPHVIDTKNVLNMMFRADGCGGDEDDNKLDSTSRIISLSYAAQRDEPRDERKQSFSALFWASLMQIMGKLYSIDDKHLFPLRDTLCSTIIMIIIKTK